MSLKTVLNRSKNKYYQKTPFSTLRSARSAAKRERDADSPRYRDIGWLMDQIDPEMVLIEKFGIDASDIFINGKELCTYCPDHILHTSREPSDPKWYLSLETGQCYCQTEGRGSNLLYTARRIWKCTLEEAIKKLLDGQDDPEATEERKDRVMKAKLARTNDKKTLHEQFLASLAPMEVKIKNCYLSQRAIDFFMQPPGKDKHGNPKRPTNITLDTLKKFQVYEERNGLYMHRSFLPIRTKGILTGYVALDTFGQDEFLKRYPHYEGRYKKVLYPGNGFERGKCLYGIDNVREECDYIIVVEGPRDVMKCWQEGFADTVSILGSSLTGEQLELIMGKRTSLIYLMLDGDNAGREGSKKIAKILKNEGYTVMDASQDGRDPKDMSAKEIAKALRNARVM